MIQKPYLLFLGDAHDHLAAKVARGIKDWRPDQAVGQYRMAECKADLGIPDMTIDEARETGARTLVVGVANRGGVISESWKAVLSEALEAGLDLASGLHSLLKDEPDLVETAARCGRVLHDVRIPTEKYPIANGRKRSGKRCLAVGTDVSVGKMYVSLAIHQEMQKRGVKSDFRATGQTGILIDGSGVPLDAVVADFMSGAVEHLTPDNDDDHWDLIEGQGSLFHVSYSGITLALVHGGQPDALILCHDATRKEMRGTPGYIPPSLEDLRDLALTLARMSNPMCRAAGAAINTSGMDQAEADSFVRDVERRLQIPAMDPIRHGANRLVDALQAI